MNCDDICKEESADTRKKLWVQVGGYLKITESEEKVIFDWDPDAASDAIREIIMSGRFHPESECRIPNESIQNFNDMYDTDYDEGEIGLEL